MIQMSTTRDQRRGTGTGSGNAEYIAATPADTRHRDGEDVVGQQRDPGHLRGQQAEVVPGHDVRATGRRVRLDRLAVREHQDRPGRRRSRATIGTTSANASDAGAPGSATAASPRSRTPPTRARRWRTPRARSACRGARGSPGRCGASGRGACRCSRDRTRERGRRAARRAVAATGRPACRLVAVIGPPR